MLLGKFFYWTIPQMLPVNIIFCSFLLPSDLPYPPWLVAMFIVRPFRLVVYLDPLFLLLLE